MPDPEHSAKQLDPRLVARVTRRAKRLLGPTLGVFGLDTEGHLLPVRQEPGERAAEQSQAATEKDDHARIAIAEAEVETDRREEQQVSESPLAP